MRDDHGPPAKGVARNCRPEASLEEKACQPTRTAVIYSSTAARNGTNGRTAGKSSAEADQAAANQILTHCSAAAGPINHKVHPAIQAPGTL